jgi:hypothetical protein
MTDITTQLDTTEAVRLATEALFVIPGTSAQFPKSVAATVVTAALPALAEQFAALIEAGVRESSDIARHETGEGAEVAPSPMRDETAPSPDDPHGACSRALVAVAVERDRARARASRLADEAEAQGRATGFAERERDEARRSLHRVRQMCDDPEIPHAGSCASYRVFKSADGPHPCDCIVADIRRAVDGE